MFLKAEEIETSERPYHIFWHGKFLRSYSNEKEFQQNLKWYKSFLLCISHVVVS